MRHLRRFALLFVLPLFVSIHAGEASAACDTTVILVRHAEAGEGSSDPELTAAGAARAEALRRALADAGVTTIYVTQFRRTRDTAAPFAAESGAKLVEVAVERATIEEQTIALAKRILTDHAGETILVVGHSNTVPMFVEALSGKSVSPIDHNEHDRLYIVTHDAKGKAGVVAARYGGD